MKKFLGGLKIQHQFATVDAHGQIGRVERVNRTIQDGANAAMITCGADQRWYLHAVLHFCHVRNRLPDLEDGKSRLELAGCGVQDVTLLYPFMCRVIGTTTHSKGKPSGENYHFLGYSSDHHAAFKLLKWGSDRMVVRGRPIV